MEGVTHESILVAGDYLDLAISDDEVGTARKLYRFMLLLRLCEEALGREYHPADEIRCPVHFCVGQEAVPAALSVLVSEDDYLYSHHRSHGFYLAKGAPMRELFAELYGKSTGANGGLAGSQDISYPARRFFSGAILAGATAISIGSALALQLQRSRSVAIAAFGEAATDEGIFWESINYAALTRLPIVFVCENNNYSVFSPLLKRTLLDNIGERVGTFGVPYKKIFGNDVMLVYRTIREAIEKARDGGGATFIEAYTHRWSGHYGPPADDPPGYRAAGELETWKRNCPVSLLDRELRRIGAITDAERAAWALDAEAEIEDCFRFAKTSPFPSVPDLAAVNLARVTPEADRLLTDLELLDFDAHQQALQAKGY